MNQIQEALEQIVDEMALPKPIDWESINYETMKKISVINTLDTYDKVCKNPHMSDSDRIMSILGIISYLQLENAAQWIMLERQRQK